MKCDAFPHLPNAYIIFNVSFCNIEWFSIRTDPSNNCTFWIFPTRRLYPFISNLIISGKNNNEKVSF